MPTVMTWSELCASHEFRGRWVALDHCRYDKTTSEPVEGTVIDVDDDLVDLCDRVRDAEYHDCTILFINDRSRATIRSIH